MGARGKGFCVLGRFVKMEEALKQGRNYFMTIDLDEIIDAIQGGGRGVSYFLNTSTGDIIMRDEKFPYRELNDIDDELDKEWGSILELPTQRDANEIRMMRDFVYQLPQGQAKDALNVALQGQGIFRRFKDVCKNYDLLNDWYEFEDMRYEEFASNWCKENEVQFTVIPKIVYRHATRRDLDLLIELKKKELGVEDDSMNFELEKYFTNHLRSNNLYQIVAWWKTKVVATGAISWYYLPPTVEQPNGRMGQLVNFWVEEEMKDKGYEKEILNRLMQEAARRKTPDLLAVDQNAELVENAGFKKMDNVWFKKIKL